MTDPAPVPTLIPTPTPEPAPELIKAPHCGLIAIVGRPNVGKSTLLNALVGQKISITSKKAQTTRHRITGVRTRGEHQFVFVDTPGFQTRQNKPLNRTLNRTVHGVLADVDVVLYVCEAARFTLGDAEVLALVPANKPVLLVANKFDELGQRDQILPWLEEMQARHAFTEFVPMSARRKPDVERLLDIVAPHLPAAPWLHEADALTDRDERFLASEMVREKLFRLTGDELPYTCTVVIEKFEEEGGDGSPGAAKRRVRIAAGIVVERESHKRMVIGEGGDRIKRIGTDARHELERLMDARVFLELWVTVRSGWADDEAHLRTYGYG
jgi:GTPase